MLDRRLIDDVIESYEAWRAECRRVGECYVRWSGSRGRDADLAFAACLAALDREESSARHLSERVGRLGGVQPGQHLYELRRA